MLLLQLCDDIDSDKNDSDDTDGADGDDLARLLVLASLPASLGVFGVEALVRPTPCGSGVLVFGI